jgi:hypothetical protein
LVGLLIKRASGFLNAPVGVAKRVVPDAADDAEAEAVEVAEHVVAPAPAAAAAAAAPAAAAAVGVGRVAGDVGAGATGTGTGAGEPRALHQRHTSRAARQTGKYHESGSIQKRDEQKRVFLLRST